MLILSAMSDRSGQSSIIRLAPYWRDWNRSKVQEHTAFMSTYALREGTAMRYREPGKEESYIIRIQARYYINRSVNCKLKYQGPAPKNDFFNFSTKFGNY